MVHSQFLNKDSLPDFGKHPKAKEVIVEMPLVFTIFYNFIIIIIFLGKQSAI